MIDVEATIESLQTATLEAANQIVEACSAEANGGQISSEDFERVWAAYVDRWGCGCTGDMHCECR